MDSFWNLSISVLFLAVVRLLLEVVQLLTLSCSYFSSLTNWMEVTQAICTMIFVSIYENNCFCILFWQWQVGVAATFLAWINMILFVSRIPKIGIYVVIFRRILKTFAKLLVLAMLLVVTFGLTFYMVFLDFNVMVSGCFIIIIYVMIIILCYYNYYHPAYVLAAWQE